MKYELWQLSQLSESEEPMPLFKIKESDSFYDIYETFLVNIKEVPCIVIVFENNKSL